MTSKPKAVVTLPDDKQILITREFNASKHAVYRAWTTPELVKRWWAGKRGSMTTVEIDLRVGGGWRYAMLANGGFEVAFHGEFREIVPDEKIVYTEVFEMPETGDPGEAEAPLNTVTFTDTASGTLMRLLTQCPTTKLRDTIIESGMEIGMQEQMDALDELAAAH